MSKELRTITLIIAVLLIAVLVAAWVFTRSGDATADLVDRANRPQSYYLTQIAVTQTAVNSP